jgi:phosphoribosylcarboxyaminoimidazole (NCAIR) mutase
MIEKKLTTVRCCTIGHHAAEYAVAISPYGLQAHLPGRIIGIAIQPVLPQKQKMVNSQYVSID